MPTTSKDGATCRRPGCSKRTAQGYKGFCPTHAYATGAVKRQVDAAGLRGLLQERVAQGWTLTGIAKAAGVSYTTLRDVHNGTTRRVRQATIAKVMNRLNETVSRPVRPAQRRLCALRMIGFRVPELATALGVNRSTVYDICLGKREFIYDHLDERVRALYSQLWDTPATSPDPRITNNGWPRPVDWNNIDDLNERPKVPVVFSDGRTHFIRTTI